MIATNRTLCVVVPVYDEEVVVRAFHARLAAVLDALPLQAEIVYVDDGSGDGTPAILAALHADDARVSVIELSRHFGKEAAVSAGLDAAHGDAVVVVDADLQDPPELIPEMVAAWQAGHDVVRMRRRSHVRASWLRQAAARLFYRAMGRVGGVDLPEEVGDFRLLSRRAVLALRRLPERARFMKGLFAWIGFRSAEIAYDRDDRGAGTTKWSYWALWNHALDGLFSFSVAPLRFVSYAGLAAALVAFAYGAKIVAWTLLFGDPVRGYPTLIVVILLLGGLQLLALGLIGEYIARLFLETKQRPVYLVGRKLLARSPLARPTEDAA